VEQRPVCLSVGGSDSCAGAGIQADLRVFEALGVQGCSAITALTAQNPETILHIQPSSIQQFKAELEAVTRFYDVRCIKTGMLYDKAHLQTLLPFLQDKIVVIDPVLIASSGTLLFDQQTAKAAYEQLIPRASLWTPNLDEAAFFLGEPVRNAAQAAQSLQQKYQTAVLVKGGHSNQHILADTFCDDQGNTQCFEHQKQALSTQKTHGTGCRLAAAIAAYLSKNNEISSSISQAIQWLQSELNR
jgi:hydroxymethylpyrimidine/phosphomethylpyrimidine kinase